MAPIRLTLEVLLISALSLSANSARVKKPHIVFMMVDDWGWADVGYHRNDSSKEIVTPKLILTAW